MNHKVNTKQHPRDLRGIPLIENSVIGGSTIKFRCQDEERTDQVAYINLRYPQFWSSYQPNIKGRISVLLNLGPYRFLVSQSPTNLSRLFEFLDGESITISTRKTGQRIAWSFQEFTDPNYESYSDWIDQGFIYSQADFNFMLTWLVHDLWIFPTKDNAMNPINKQLKTPKSFTKNDLQIWKLKIQIVNQEYIGQVRVVGNNFKRLVIPIKGTTIPRERNYNWRTGSDQKNYQVSNGNVLIPTKIYPYQAYLGCKKTLRKDRPQLPKNYWYSTSKTQLKTDYQVEKMDRVNDQQIWHTKMIFINAEYRLKFLFQPGPQCLMVNKKLYPYARFINDRDFNIDSVPGVEYPIYKFYTNQKVANLPELYQYSSLIPKPFRSKIANLIDF